MARPDPHSYADDTHPQATSFAWKARLDFAQKVLHATLTLRLPGPCEGPLDLDTRDLTLDAITTQDGAPIPFVLHPPEPVLGARLSLSLPPGTHSLTLTYRTAPHASALQWLEPVQTAGGEHPYLFSQCQAIHARSVLPLQDTPRVRVTWEAEVTVPRALRALMAAAHQGRDEAGDTAVERFVMPQPIPPYLFGLAVGDLVSREVGPRSRVWAEPRVVDRAAWEFVAVDAMMSVGEGLFGPYDWDRFDVLVMPPSFPYGGMENPRLTFVTPTLLAGDRSQVRVIAHELAHSWTGNLITNANAEHFWLNEGWTRYAELRIVEALEGEDVAALHAALGARALERTLAAFKTQGRLGLTRLRTHLSGVDPDDAFSEVPYEKGCMFLQALERHVGRPRFDAFLRTYMGRYRFGVITTEAFLSLVAQELPGALEAVDAPRWIDHPGLPEGVTPPRSARLDRVLSLGTKLPDADAAWGLSSAEWQLYLESLPLPASLELCRGLDARFGLTSLGNHEVLVAWLCVALGSGYDAVLPRALDLLGEVGRMRYLKPLYRCLLDRPETAPRAREAFAQHAAGYHPIARAVLQAMMS